MRLGSVGIIKECGTGYPGSPKEESDLKLKSMDFSVSRYLKTRPPEQWEGCFHLRYT